MTRQIILDTETTGLEPAAGHRIIEIGCVELIDRKLSGQSFHVYINPEREIDEGAVEVHGLSAEFLADKPRFADIADDFLGFVEGAELIIHNAPFDVGFINHELRLLDASLVPIAERCSVIDTLLMARKKHPGQRNSLDALCKRYGIDNSQRTLHGALLDAEILAEVYLAMTGGQITLSLEHEDDASPQEDPTELFRTSGASRPALPVIAPSPEELAAHLSRLQDIHNASSGNCLWSPEP
ncbi:MAG: polymerase epsilon subunit [Pseudomonadota bacterium]|jgi:DNA polymerase-3 subunit epsilon